MNVPSSAVVTRTGSIAMEGAVPSPPTTAVLPGRTGETVTVAPGIDQVAERLQDVAPAPGPTGVREPAHQRGHGEPPRIGLAEGGEELLALGRIQCLVEVVHQPNPDGQGNTDLQDLDGGLFHGSSLLVRSSGKITVGLKSLASSKVMCA